MLPESAQKNRRVQRDLVNKTVAEFTTLAIEAFPDQLIEKRISWSLKPTMSQAGLYDRILTKVQDFGMLQTGKSLVSKEDALEYILQEAEERLWKKVFYSYIRDPEGKNNRGSRRHRDEIR